MFSKLRLIIIVFLIILPCGSNINILANAPCEGIATPALCRVKMEADEKNAEQIQGYAPAQQQEAPAGTNFNPLKTALEREQKALKAQQVNLPTPTEAPAPTPTEAPTQPTPDNAKGSASPLGILFCIVFLGMIVGGSKNSSSTGKNSNYDYSDYEDYSTLPTPTVTSYEDNDFVFTDYASPASDSDDYASPESEGPSSYYQEEPANFQEAISPLDPELAQDLADRAAGVVEFKDLQRKYHPDANSGEEERYTGLFQDLMKHK